MAEALCERQEESASLTTVHLIPAALVERAVEDLPVGTILVICDAEGARAATMAARVTSHKTAVFVGDLSDDNDRQSAVAFATEQFGDKEPKVYGTTS